MFCNNLVYQYNCLTHACACRYGKYSKLPIHIAICYAYIDT